MTRKIFNWVYKALGLGLIPGFMEPIPLPLPLTSVLKTKGPLITVAHAKLRLCSLLLKHCITHEWGKGNQRKQKVARHLRVTGFEGRTRE